MGCCTEAEIALKERFEITYGRSTQSVMQRIERSVLGCDYGGCSWTTKEQADALPGLLALDAGSDLVDLGAGTGWPGLYLAKVSGCRVSLVDLPEIGLRLAEKRAQRDGLAGRVSVHVADASRLPFEPASFDAVSHSDLLCCLVEKRAALRECRRIIRPEGRMAFSVIFIAPGLSTVERARALADAPQFAESDCDYEALLSETGWQVTRKADLTEAYRLSCARQIEADRIHRVELIGLIGLQAAEERMASWSGKISVIEDGLLLREQYVCRPC